MILKEADKERLSEIKEVLEKLKLKFPVAEINKRTGEDKGNISKYLNGKIPISNNFYTTFMEKFTAPSRNPHTKEESGSDLMVTIRELSHSGAMLAEANRTIAEANNTIAAANKILSDNNKELISLVLKSPNLSDAKENQLAVSAVSRPTLEKMAAAGIPDLWRSRDEGLVILGKLLIGGEVVKQE